MYCKLSPQGDQGCGGPGLECMSELVRLSKTITCLFCRKPFSPREAAPEHVIPQSLYGTMTTYYVCQPCNAYFARKLETSLQEYVEVRKAKERLAEGEIRRSTPLQVTDGRRFKRFLGKVALEFLGETNYSVATDQIFDPWRELVRHDVDAAGTLNRISYRDIYKEMPGWKPSRQRSWHGVSLIETAGEILCSISLYSQLLATVWLGPTPAGKPLRWYELVQSIRRRPRRNEPAHMLHQNPRPRLTLSSPP